MSHSQQHSNLPSQPRQTNILHTPSEPFRLLLTPQQAASLLLLLPTAHSLQPQPKCLQPQPKSYKRIPSKTPSQDLRIEPQPKKKNHKDHPKNAPKNIPSRISKQHSRLSQQTQNALFQKYNIQKDHRKHPPESLNQTLRPCLRLLTLLKNNRTSWPFRQPVDPIALGIPHYTQIIQQPMDLSTIQNNLRTNIYITPTQFHADVAKIITNSYTFNASNIEFTRITAQFENYYRKIMNENLPEGNRNYSMDYVPETLGAKAANMESKKAKKENREGEYRQTTSISMAEKKELGLSIKKLPKESMKGLLEIVSEGKGKMIGEFDLKELDPQIIRKLQIYVKERLAHDHKPRGMERPVEKSESSFEVGEQSQS